MPIDPILAAHFVQDFVFEIGGQFSPASVRDQMIRAYTIVDRAFQQGIIGPGLPVLIVGAGSTGVTAAMRAAQLGVDTTIVERRAHHAFLLARCRTRDVEPTLYDWPAAHWAANRFESAGASMPLRWTSSKANLISLHWQHVLARALRAYTGRMRILFGTHVSFPSGVRASSVDLHRSGVTQNHSYAAVISCVGWGRENCAHKGYQGLQFWENDDLETLDFGLGAGSAPRILISGGGDGALQDFVRAMTGKGTRDVFREIHLALAPTSGAMLELERQVLVAEDVAARALSWSLPAQDQPIFERLEREHLAAIQRLKSVPAVWAAVSAAVARVMRGPPPDVTLIHRGPVFTQCYPLNRFLVLLLLEVLGHHHRVQDADLATVSCAHAPPSGGPRCYGQTHDVTSAVNGRSVTGRYEIVIIRHGILGPRSLVGGPGPAHARQMLPYFVEV